MNLQSLFLKDSEIYLSDSRIENQTLGGSDDLSFQLDSV